MAGPLDYAAMKTHAGALERRVHDLETVLSRCRDTLATHLADDGVFAPLEDADLHRIHSCIDMADEVLS